MRKAMATSGFLLLAGACAMPVGDGMERTDSTSQAATVTPFPHWGQFKLRHDDWYGPASGWCLKWQMSTDTGDWWFIRTGCDPNDPYQFFTDPAREIIKGAYNQCLSDVWNANNARPAMQPCNAADNRQWWSYRSDGDVANLGNCFGLYSGTRGMESLGIPVCNTSSYNSLQGFNFAENIPTYATANALVVMRNRCLDNGGPNFAQGRQLQTWDCIQSGAQRFQWNPWNGQIKDLSTGMCLDILGFNNANGAAVDEWPCNGYPNQSWQVSPDGQIVSNWNNRCLEVANWNGNNGAPIQMWDCTGNFNQHWDHQ